MGFFQGIKNLIINTYQQLKRGFLLQKIENKEIHNNINFKYNSAISFWTIFCNIVTFGSYGKVESQLHEMTERYELAHDTIKKITTTIAKDRANFYHNVEKYDEKMSLLCTQILIPGNEEQKKIAILTHLNVNTLLIKKHHILLGEIESNLAIYNKKSIYSQDFQTKITKSMETYEKISKNFLDSID